MHWTTSRRSLLMNATGLGLTLAGLFPVRQARSGISGYNAVGEQARSFEQLHAIIVATGGTVRLAEAFRGPPIDRPVNVKSVSKTVVATLAGIAIDRGYLNGTDALAAPFLDVPPDADPRVGAITIDHLLTMRAGLERTSGANYGTWVQSRDWVANALARPFVDEPGGRFLYSTGSYHLLGAVLAGATGRSLHRLAADWLGDPLGISVPAWTRDPQGRFMGGNNMRLSPLAMLRFGELWRQQGAWAGTQIVAPDWVAASWTPRTRSPFSGHAYGYGWFLARAGDYDLAYARGYGGQMIFVVPDLRLTVAITSDPKQPARSRGYAGDLHRLLAEAIIPAAEGF